MRAHLLHIALAKCQQALAFGCARGMRWHSVAVGAKRLTDEISYGSVAMLVDLPAPEKRRLYWAILTLKHISIQLLFLLCSLILRQTEKSEQEVLIGRGALLIRQERVCVAGRR